MYALIEVDEGTHAVLACTFPEACSKAQVRYSVQTGVAGGLRWVNKQEEPGVGARREV